MKQKTKTTLLRNGKRILLSLVLLLVITFRGTIKDIVTPEKPVSKTIEIALFSNSDYSKEIYRHSTAKIQLTISKYRNKKFHTLYQTTLNAGNLNKLPSEQNAAVRAITVNRFYKRKETLVATYTVSYESNGSVLKYDKHVLLSDNRGVSELSVGI